jgi:hypothetical protein
MRAPNEQYISSKICYETSSWIIEYCNFQVLIFSNPRNLMNFDEKSFNAIDDLQFIRVRVVIQLLIDCAKSRGSASARFHSRVRRTDLLCSRSWRWLRFIPFARCKWKGRGIETRKILFPGAGIKTFQPANQPTSQRLIIYSRAKREEDTL